MLLLALLWPGVRKQLGPSSMGVFSSLVSLIDPPDCVFASSTVTSIPLETRVLAHINPHIPAPIIMTCCCFMVYSE